MNNTNIKEYKLKMSELRKSGLFSHVKPYEYYFDEIELIVNKDLTDYLQKMLTEDAVKEQDNYIVFFYKRIDGDFRLITSMTMDTSPNKPSIDGTLLNNKTSFPFSKFIYGLPKDINTKNNKTKNNKTKKEKKTMKNFMEGLINMDANLNAVETVAKIELGKAALKKGKKLLKKQLPMFVKGYVDSPFFDIVIANIAVTVASKVNNSKFNKVADAMMLAAMSTSANFFNVEKILDDFLDGLPLGDGDENTED
jgi:hypothetical protein